MPNPARARHSSTLIVLMACLAVLLVAARPAQAQPDEQDVELLARTIFHEASGEGRQGMIAVGWVVLNRTHDPSFPRSIPGVIRQRQGGACQWSWACRERRAPSGAGWVRAQAIAAMMLTEPPPDPTNGAVWLQPARAPRPNWGIKIFQTARIGNHVFYGRAPAGSLQLAER